MKVLILDEVVFVSWFGVGVFVSILDLLFNLYMYFLYFGIECCIVLRSVSLIGWNLWFLKFEFKELRIKRREFSLLMVCEVLVFWFFIVV